MVLYMYMKISKEKREEIRAEYNLGATKDELISKYHCSPIRMYQIIRGEEYIKKLAKSANESLKRKRAKKYEKGVTKNCVIQDCTNTFTAFSPKEYRCKKHIGQIQKPYIKIAYKRKCEVPSCDTHFLPKDTGTRFYCSEHSEELKKFTGRDLVSELVRIRDNKTCQNCHKKWNGEERRFDIHHLNGNCGKLSNSYDSRMQTDGLTTLCHKCHMSKHSAHLTRIKLNKTTEAKKEAIVALHGLGWSTHKIAKATNCKQPTVSRLLSRVA